MKYLQILMANLAALGPRRLSILAVSGALITGLILFVFHSLGEPVRTTLYSNLDKADVSAIGAALSEVGIAFDVSQQGDAVLVDFDSASKARMILAELGLPKSDKSGYELFDKMGSLGLTSFMQQVTKVRALEGELDRTIQSLDGVKSARVHLALRAEGMLRLKENKPTASVVIRVVGEPREGLANTVRHVVAAAIPGLTPDQVMVSTTDGRLLAGPSDSENAGAETLLDLESRVSQAIAKRVSNTLEPFAGAENFRVSVAATLNFDKRQVNETKFDPESKVERSILTRKSSDRSQEASEGGAVSVDQNIPQEVKADSGASGGSSAKKEEKQETINYEVNSRQTETTSAGYQVERISLAVVIDRKAVLAGLGAAADEAAVTKRLEEIREVVQSAAGIVKGRGDTAEVSAIEFYQDEEQAAVADEAGIVDRLMGNMGTIINALGLVAALIVVLQFGLKPALKMLLQEPQPAAAPPMEMAVALALPENGAAADGAMLSPSPMAPLAAADSRERLNELVNADVDRAAQVLKGWLAAPERNAA